MTHKVILNIANNYFGSKLYENLLNAQSEAGFSAKVISFLSYSECEKQKVPANCLLLSEPKIFNRLFRIIPILRFYYHKASIINFTKHDHVLYVHSHTVHSNGSLGNLLSAYLGCKHIVSIRNTDINYAFKYFIHLHFLYRNTISSAYKVTAPNLPFAKIVAKKFNRQPTIMPNPIDRFWEDNKPLITPRYDVKTLSICTLGAINKNKNQLSVVKALANFTCPISYTLIGEIEDKKYFALIEAEAQKNNIEFIHVEYIDRREDLLDLIRTSQIMCLASYKETFGLAYIESAMAGLAVVYSKSQGIDGILEEGKIGYAASPRSIEEIYKAINMAKKLDPALVSCIAISKFGHQNHLKTLQETYA